MRRSGSDGMMLGGGDFWRKGIARSAFRDVERSSRPCRIVHVLDADHRAARVGRRSVAGILEEIGGGDGSARRRSGGVGVVRLS